MNGSKLPGVLCPACGGGTMVFSTRANELSLAGGLRRRRRCRTPACATRFTTVEERVPDQEAEARTLHAAAELGRDYLALDEEGRRAIRKILDAMASARQQQPEAHAA